LAQTDDMACARELIAQAHLLRHHRTGPPTLGQHNDEILRNLVLSEDEVAALRTERVIGERVHNA
jgi:crotonobetainyl-CoA:carnitine CoA-transferase CaiB-like acyl-CoA transferase